MPIPFGESHLARIAYAHALQTEVKIFVFLRVVNPLPRSPLRRGSLYKIIVSLSFCQVFRFFYWRNRYLNVYMLCVILKRRYDHSCTKRGSSDAGK